MSDLAQKTPARSAAEEALLDAAERLLVDVGYAGITTRRLAEEAGVTLTAPSGGAQPGIAGEPLGVPPAGGDSHPGRPGEDPPDPPGAGGVSARRA